MKFDGNKHHIGRIYRGTIDYRINRYRESIYRGTRYHIKKREEKKKKTIYMDQSEERRDGIKFLLRDIYKIITNILQQIFR